MSESDPTGRKAHEPGAKLDTGKAPVLRGALHYFPRAIAAVSRVSEVGAKKYSWKGWETVPDGIHRYGDALARHLLAEDYEAYDKDTGVLHAEQVAWNALARLELMLRAREAKLAATNPSPCIHDPLGEGPPCDICGRPWKYKYVEVKNPPGLGPDGPANVKTLTVVPIEDATGTP